MTARTAASRLETLLPLLACPACHGALRMTGPSLHCPACPARYPIHAGRPVFLPGPDTSPRVMPPDHISNQGPGELLDWMTWFDGWVLNVGAGGTRIKIENCVEVEYSIFRHTDVVTDAHHLPFADGAFDAVVSFNTFEHLYDPGAAASEISRVLKPGGRVIVTAAFLQPVHESPHHYYNATEYGMRKWFETLDITSVSVPGYFQPANVLAWLATEILRAVEASQGMEARERLAASSLGSWQSAWHEEQRGDHPLWHLLEQLPQEKQRRFAAGFQLDATKPEPDRQCPW